MTRRMLIDATQAEETRVVVLENDRLDTYDFDSSIRKQIKGNIFLAKVTRVEPSLQACFVEYGGNRQGFLAFTEIHPDYYRIPVEDRQALLAEEAAEWNEEEEEFDISTGAGSRRRETEQPDMPMLDMEMGAEFSAESQDELQQMVPPHAQQPEMALDSESDNGISGEAEDLPESPNLTEIDRDNTIESVGGEEESSQSGRTRRVGKLRRRYKIQEVIKRRQIMLVQATKEERGAKGAAVTTYISLPGRYCVLMPNSPRGGGVSRKITDPQARRKMKDLLSELEVPNGMSVILRTAGMTRTRLDIKRDLEYLLRLWDEIRRDTLKAEAPALIYEEADIFKRTIRDLYSGETKEVIVSGEEGFKRVKTFMRQMVPAHCKRVLYYRDPMIPLFQRYGVEPQIANVFNPRVELKSGGYIIINPTEALVSIDVNSGKATRERHIDDTALKTNLEAAEEVARQLRLRDLGGLVVIDFIDMDSSRHNAKVERKLREAMSEDRARIEIGRISGFGLLELSRQRLHPSLTETHFQPCEHCNGTGMTRTTDSAAVVVMRAIEAEAVRGRAISITANIPQSVAIYLLNYKREEINLIEERFGIRVSLRADEAMMPNDVDITFEKGQPQPKGKTELLPVPVLEGSDDDFVNAAAEEDNGEPLMNNLPERGSRDRDRDEGDEEEGGRNRRPRSSRGGRGRREKGSDRSSERNSDRPERSERNGERRSRRNEESPGENGEARIIPITTLDADGNEIAPEAIQNPTAEGQGKRRRERNGERGERGGRSRHPYRRRRNGERGERSEAENAAAQDPNLLREVYDKPDAPMKNLDVPKAPRAPRQPRDAAANNDQPAPNQMPGKEAKKKGWWQKLIE